MINVERANENARLYASKVAVKTDSKQITWSEYAEMVNNAIVNFDKKYDIEKIHRVMVISKNRWELLIIYSVLSSLKIPYTGLDYTSTDVQREACFENLGPDLIVYSNEFSYQVDDFQGTQFLNIDADMNKLIEKTDISAVDDIVAKNKDRGFESMSFTSGTSGIPKIVYRNSSFAARRSKKLTELYNFIPEDVFLITLPFYHVSIAGWLRLFMNLGCTSVFCDFNDSADVYNKLMENKITTMLIVPPTLTKLLNYMDDQDKQTSLKFIIVGGKNFPASVKQKAIKYLGPVVNEYYGSTETGINVLSDSNMMQKNPYSSGVAMEGSEIIILDENKNILPYKQVGRIAIHSYQNALKYLHNPLNTVDIEGKTYIITADNGYMDEFGYLYVISRTDTLETKVSFNLFRIENRIRLLSGVTDVVLTTKHAEDKDYLVAFVSVEEYVEDAMKEDLREIIKCIMESDIECKIKFVDKIPYSLSGKVKIRQLED